MHKRVRRRAEEGPHRIRVAQAAGAGSRPASRPAIMLFVGGVLAASVIAIMGAPARAQSLPPGFDGMVYTADEAGHSISAIKLSSGKVASVPVSISPHNVEVSTDGTHLLAVGNAVVSGAAHGNEQNAHASAAEGRLLVFKTSAMSAGPVATLAVGIHPAHVIADGTDRAFIALSGEDAAAVIDLRGGAIIRKLSVGRSPHGLRKSPDGSLILVANVQDGSVSVIDVAKLAEIKRIPVGRAPVQVGFTPDSRRFYVSLRDENRVAVVDLAAMASVERIDVGRGPIQVHATPDGRRIYVANQGTAAEPDDTVSVIETATNKVIDTIRTETGAHGVAVSRDGRLVFVSNIAAGTVSVIDNVTRRVIRSVSVGRGPNGITFGPEPVAPTC